MVREAQLRQAYNKQRRQFKNMLATASSGSASVRMKDLQLAAKVSKMDIPDYLLATNTFSAVGRDRVGSASHVRWRPFFEAVEYPALRGAGGFDARELPVLRRDRTKSVAVALESAPEAVVRETVDDADVIKYFEMVRAKLQDRFSELRRAFRTIDADGSGYIDHTEVTHILRTFNLGIPEPVLAKIISLADFVRSPRFDGHVATRIVRHAERGAHPLSA